nr:flavin reductase [Methanobacterium formicicum]
MQIKNFKRESIIPLPVTFISTLSPDGVKNVAPYSCIMPILRPFDLICVATAGVMRDTFDNLRAREEFVISLPGMDLADKVMPTAKFVPPEVNEYELAGLDEKPSQKIETPGVEAVTPGWNVNSIRSLPKNMITSLMPGGGESGASGSTG